MEIQTVAHKQKLNQKVINLVICFLPLFGFTQKTQLISDSTLFEIYFSDGFDSDTVSFSIDNIPLPEKLILKSNPYYGQCEAKIIGKYYSSDSILLLINTGVNEIFFSLKKEKEYDFQLIVAPEKHSFAFDLDKGNYLLIYRVPSKKIIFGQRRSRPSFE